MARVTVEDCLKKVDNRFELVALASKRARQIERGSEPKLEVLSNASKPAVIALREVAEGLTSEESLVADAFSVEDRE